MIRILSNHSCSKTLENCQYSALFLAKELYLSWRTKRRQIKISRKLITWWHLYNQSFAHWFSSYTKYLSKHKESAKLHPWCAHVTSCLSCKRAHVPTCLACLCAQLPTCLAWLRAHVQTCCVVTYSRANVPCVLLRSRANVPDVPTCSLLRIFQLGYVINKWKWLSS